MSDMYTYALQNSEGDLAMGQEHFGPTTMMSDSTAPYLNPRKNRCSGKGNTCNAYSTKDTRETTMPLCVGCSRGVDE